MTVYKLRKFYMYAINETDIKLKTMALLSSHDLNHLRIGCVSEWTDVDCKREKIVLEHAKSIFLVVLFSCIVIIESKILQSIYCSGYAMAGASWIQQKCEIIISKREREGEKEKKHKHTHTNIRTRDKIAHTITDALLSTTEFLAWCLVFCWFACLLVWSQKRDMAAKKFV